MTMLGKGKRKGSRSEALEEIMRVSKGTLHPNSKNRFKYHAHSNYAFAYGRMTPCKHNPDTTP